MLYRPLGRTGLTVSEVGFGCASWWGQRLFSEAEALRLVHEAVDAGITLFDTGAVYSGGEAEPRLGRALKGRNHDRLVVATKAGTWREGGQIRRDMSPDKVEACAVRSLRRLGLDRLDILQLHGPSALELTPALMERLADLKGRGLVRAVGVTSFDPAVIEAALGQPELDLVMIDYNVLRPERTGLIARAAAAGKGVLAGMPLAMGHTQGQVLKLRGLRDVWYALRALKNHRADIAKGRRFAFLNSLPDLSGAQAALAWVLGDPNVASAVTGVTRLAHLRENAAASGLALSPHVRARIESVQQGRAG